jgi:hypothetical protein
MLSPQVLVPALAPAAALLRAASRVLARAARRLAEPAARSLHVASSPVLEFHADAGAPEGALYADGVLVGHLDGVKRL